MWIHVHVHTLYVHLSIYMYMYVCICICSSCVPTARMHVQCVHVHVRACVYTVHVGVVRGIGEWQIGHEGEAHVLSSKAII